MSSPIVLNKETAISWGLAIGIFGVVFASGIVFQRVNTIETRVDKLEAERRLTEVERDRLTRVEEKVNAIDGKFDLLFNSMELKLTKKPSPSHSQ